MILTNNELAELSEEYGPFSFDIYRAVEQAVIAKLSQGVEVPESLYVTSGDVKDINSFTRNQLKMCIAASRIKALEDAARWLDFYDGPINARRAEAIRVLKVLSQPKGE